MYALDGAVAVEEVVVRLVEDEDRVGNVLEQGARAKVALLEGIRGALAIGDVLVDREDSGVRAVNTDLDSV